MTINLPFYPNDGDGNQCVQAALRSVIAHYLGDDYSLEELDRITGRLPGVWTWTEQAVMALDRLSFEVTHHETGPQRKVPHRRIAKERFVQAWEAKGTDKDTIIVYGLKT